MTNILEKIKELVDFYVKWVQAAKNREDGDEAALELMELEGMYIHELSRPGRIIKDSSFARGSKIVADTRPKEELVRARLNIVTEGLKKVKAIYQQRNWEF